MRVRRITLALASAFAIVLASAVPVGVAHANGVNAPTATVTGPIVLPENTYPFLSTDIDLERYGYVEEEFFLSGAAYRYDTSGGVDQVASKIQTGGPNSNGTYPFNTRIVVRRPADPGDANGVVLAEWNNVTSTQDVEFNWFGDPYFLLRNGYTFVGVTAQTNGVASLKSFSLPRYRNLTVNGNDTVPTGTGLDRDALSYDIFSSVVKALKGTRAGGSADPLGGITADAVIASGESQSCGRLANHYNKFQPLHGVVDGYLLTVCGSQLRTDRPEKAVRVLSELENQVQRLPEAFPDTDSMRHWEVAAGSHLPRLAWDNLDDLLNRDFLELTVECQKFPLSLVEWPFTVNRAIDGLSDWIAGGQAPPIAPRGEYVPNPNFNPQLPVSASNPEVVLDRDEFGNAKGGIRYPTVMVPTATNTGINGAAENATSPFSGFCGLLGSSTEFDRTTLDGLYRDHADYVQKYSQAADEFLATGFILAEDVARLKKFAREFPRLRPARPTIKGKGKSLKITWVGTEAPATKFTVQKARVGVKQKKWLQSNFRINGRTASLAREPKGTWVYRVRSSTVIPANNISPPQRVTTPFSEASRPVRTGYMGFRGQPR